MTTVAIMQPTFLPWSGYVDLMDQVDMFVNLDSVQFAHRSWQHRNQVLVNDELRWISVPTVAADRRTKRIDEIEIGSSDDFPDRVVSLIDESLRTAPYVDNLDTIKELISQAQPGTRLVDLNLALLEELRTLVGVTTPMVRSSALPVDGTRSRLLVSIASHLGATTYVTAPGSLDYLVDDTDLFDQAGIDIEVHQFSHPVYPQSSSAFVPHASIIDLIANVGPEAGPLLRSGRLPTQSLTTAAVATGG